MHHQLPGEGVSVEQILGAVDAMKFRSSLTLFAKASGNEPVFIEALDQQDAVEVIHFMLKDATLKLVGLNRDFISVKVKADEEDLISHDS